MPLTILTGIRKNLKYFNYTLATKLHFFKYCLRMVPCKVIKLVQSDNSHQLSVSYVQVRV